MCVCVSLASSQIGGCKIDNSHMRVYVCMLQCVPNMYSCERAGATPTSKQCAFLLVLVCAYPCMCRRMYVPVCVDVCVAREGERKPRKSNIPKESAIVVLCVFLFGKASPHAGLFIPSHVTAQHIRASALPYASVQRMCVCKRLRKSRELGEGGELARKVGR